MTSSFPKIAQNFRVFSTEMLSFFVIIGPPVNLVALARRLFLKKINEYNNFSKESAFQRFSSKHSFQVKDKKR